MRKGLQLRISFFFWPFKTFVILMLVGLSACSGSSSNLPPAPAATDQQSPQVIETIPPVDANIVIEFSEPMLSSTFDDTTSFTVQSLSGADVFGTFSFNGNVVTFNPDSDFTFNATYIVAISILVTDLVGNALNQQELFSFSTGADTIPPTATFLSPVNNDTDIVTLPVIEISFSEPMLAASVSDQTFWLTDSNGATVAGSIDYNPATLRATFTPAQKLSLLETYTVTLTPGAAGIRDLAGNGISATGNEITFSTKDGAWGTTTELLSSGTQSTWFPFVVADQAGNALAVWSEINGSGVYTLRSKRYVNDGSTGWINVTNPVQGVGTSSVFDYEIAMNTNGNAIVVWAHGGVIYHNRFTNGNWGTAASIDSSGAGSSNAKVAMSANGNAMAIWSKNNNIWSNTFSPGNLGVVNGSWSGTTLVEANQTRSGVSATSRSITVAPVLPPMPTIPQLFEMSGSIMRLFP